MGTYNKVFVSQGTKEKFQEDYHTLSMSEGVTVKASTLFPVHALPQDEKENVGFQYEYFIYHTVVTKGEQIKPVPKLIM